MVAGVADTGPNAKAPVENTDDTHATLQKALCDVRAQAAAVQRSLAERARAMTRETDAYVHQNPWQVIAIGAGLGWLVGWLASRR